MAMEEVLAGEAGGVVRTKKSLGPLPTLATAFSRLCDRFHRDCGDRRRFRTRGLLPHHAPPRGLRNYCAMTVDSQIFSWGEVIRPFSARTPQTRSPRTLSTAASILLFASDHRTLHRDLIPTSAVPLRAHSIHFVASSSSPAPSKTFSSTPLPLLALRPTFSRLFPQPISDPNSSKTPTLRPGNRSDPRSTCPKFLRALRSDFSVHAPVRPIGSESPRDPFHMLREALDFGLTLVPTPDITIPTNSLSRHPRPLRHKSLGPSDLVRNLCPWFSELSIRLNVAIRLALHSLYFLSFLSFSPSTL